MGIEIQARDVDIIPCSLLRLLESLDKGNFFPDTRELNKHGKVNTGDDLNQSAVHDRYRQIRRRAAEHIRQDYDAVTAIHLLDRSKDCITTFLHIVLRSDRYRHNLLLRPDNMLKRSYELLRQVPVSYND